MFGIYRFILAGMVTLAHLASPVIDWTGVYAVFCFYLLSGYLMTLVLNERYGFNFDGLSRYAINRILRIFPPYLAVLLVGFLVVILIPETAKNTNSALSMPSTSMEWLHNIFIFGINGDPNRLVPPAWSVDVELFFYCSMGLILARNKYICVAWFVSSLAISIFMIMTEEGFGRRYGSVLGASLPFSMGSMMYYFNNRVSTLSHSHLFIASALFLLYTGLSNYLWENPRNMGFYLSLVLAIYLQICLTKLSNANISFWLIALDRRLGDLSYPIFLCHWHIAAIIVFSAPFGISTKGLSLFIIGFLVSCCAAFAINQCIEKPIVKIRDYFRTPIGECSATTQG